MKAWALIALGALSGFAGFALATDFLYALQFGLMAVGVFLVAAGLLSRSDRTKS